MAFVHHAPLLRLTSLCTGRCAWKCLRLSLDLHRFAARTWVYPAGIAERAYQVAIVEQALLQNTLVCLPTGLGKTFIAAVVMYNFFRWFPEVCLAFTPTHMKSACCLCSCALKRCLPVGSGCPSSTPMKPAQCPGNVLDACTGVCQTANCNDSVFSVIAGQGGVPGANKAPCASTDGRLPTIHGQL